MRIIRADRMVRCEVPCGADEDALAESTRRTIASVTLELRSNVQGLAAVFAHRYSDHPPLKRTDFVYRVLQDETGYTMWCAHDGAWRWSEGLLPLDAVLFLADAAVVAALVHFDARLASMHAAGVECFGVAAAIAAESEGGKTITALACARAGMRIYSDERVMLRDRVVLPFLRRASVREESIELMHSDGWEDLTLAAAASAISWTEAFGPNRIAAPAELRAVFLITGKGNLHIEQVRPVTILKPVSRWFDCKAGALDRVSRVLSLLQSVRCYAMTLGTPAETANALVGELGNIAAQ